MSKTRLFPIIAVAVTLLGGSSIWLLVEVWRNKQPIDSQDAEHLSLQNDLNLQQMQGGLTDRVANSLNSEQQERMQSPLGLAMFRKCVEWTEFNDNHPSEAARANEQQACDEFRRYVDSGDVPN